MTSVLSDCFTNYFVMSQQIGTRIKLCADGRHARGLLLQQLPADRLKDEEERAASWQHLTALATTLTADELLGLDNETVLHRLYHEEQVRLFDVQHLRFSCSCSRERSGNALVSLGLEDALALAKRLEQRIVTLETILDVQQPDWRRHDEDRNHRS